MKKSDISEQLVKSTVRIVNQKPNDSISVGTGFFFSYNPDVSWNARIEAIVTNKHMIENSKILKFTFRTQSTVGDSKKGLRNYELTNPQLWTYTHPDPSVDLCIIFLKPITDHFLNTYGETLDIAYYDKNLIPDEDAISNFSYIEDVIMIGYPYGIYEPNKFYPIIRKGITATPFDVDFNNKKEFLTDIFAIGGSSGSPILLIKGQHPYLLGIHYGGLANNELNLGLNIKSSQIIEMYDSFISLKLQDPEQKEFYNTFKK